MKKLATTLFGLFLMATSFANVNSNEVTLPTNRNNLTATVQVAPHTATAQQALAIMVLSNKHKSKKGPRTVVQGCLTKCDDEL